MLNSAIFEKYGFDLQNEIEERYQDIFDYFIGLWQDDSIFDSSYRDLFPPGFIDRNRERAMTIIRDLNDIVYSMVIRQKLAPIYTYVLENMIEIWYTSAEELEMDILPKTVKTYLKKVDSEQADYIRSWFTDAGACVEDFLEAYDAELLFTDFAEVIAERFLKDPRDIEDIGMLGVKLTDLLDLLPNDLYNRVMEVLEKDDVTTNILRALERLCNNKLDFKDFDENGLNRRVRDYLYGYTVLDQTQQGLGENGKDPGSLDILIKENGLNAAIYEGLNHRNKKYLFDHIDKTVGRYNPSGCRSIYIGEYYRAKRFSMAWNNTVKSLQEKYTGTEVDTGRNGIRLFKIREERIDIWVFGVDMVLD